MAGLRGELGSEEVLEQLGGVEQFVPVPACRVVVGEVGVDRCGLRQEDLVGLGGERVAERGPVRAQVLQELGLRKQPVAVDGLGDEVEVGLVAAHARAALRLELDAARKRADPRQRQDVVSVKRAEVVDGQRARGERRAELRLVAAGRLELAAVSVAQLRGDRRPLVRADRLDDVQLRILATEGLVERRAGRGQRRAERAFGCLPGGLRL